MLTVAVTFLAGLLAALVYQKMFYPFLWADLGYYFKLRMYRKSLLARTQRGIITYLDCFLLQVRTKPDKTFIIHEDQRLTYRDVDRRSNQFANALGRKCLKEGDIVAMLMANEPDFIHVWFGLCKLGCQVAFLNTNNKSKSLLHCIRSCDAKALVVGTGLVHLVEDLLPDLKEDNTIVFVAHQSAPSEGFISLLDKLENNSTENQNGLPKVDIMSNFLFIFTSGTTGATCVLKKKFSASQFWKDCVKYNVTVVQYIGELCRYLVSHPRVPEESSHSVRLATGSGLRSDVWKEFAKRFGRIKIREGYGLTEASIGFLNYTDEVGPIGRASAFNKLSMPFELLRYDTQTYEPLRTTSGRCVRAQKGETGILVAPLTPMNQFPGYAGNKVQSEKKLVKDVFRTGDVYFNTGDLLLQDQRDFLYFRDRVGDTFRWKGENVSTMEVSEVLCLLDFIQDASVYGVTISGYEGRAGMAAIVLKADHGLNGAELYKHLVEALPSYAWPWFLRIRPSLDVTDTFKQQKGKLVQEGFNPDVIMDPLFFLDITQRDYILLSGSLYEDIVLGNIKL
ncbi:long-chain fatty acid transport protein 6 isoform X2 [Nerophis lumbriciformis]|uniref:long-chain fatty acid transport protein 6 isoform X2 n=1 Tax=Nerophis lumbriciformis TaxID=546530 RepID=UPI003BAA9A15